MGSASKLFMAKLKTSLKGWIVERTFAWFNIYRRLSKDYETTTHMAEAFIMITNIRLYLNRIKYI